VWPHQESAGDAAGQSRPPTRLSADLAHLAEGWGEQADVTRLHVLLLHARIVLADLAGTEQGIADTLLSLATQGGPEAAGRWRQAAVQAAREAESARDRARALQELEASTLQRPAGELSGPAANPEAPSTGTSPGSYPSRAR
jgi:hypothetical protein